MDPFIVTIVGALAAGAAAAAKNVATTAIGDAYAGLKRLIASRYQRAAASADDVEADPTSTPEQQVLAKKLDQAGASGDAELKAAARALLEALEALRSEPRAAALFDFDKFRALKSFQVEGVETLGTLFRAND